MFGTKSIYRYSSFYKSLVDSIPYNAYDYPHLKIKLRHDYEESEAQSIRETAKRADRKKKPMSRRQARGEKEWASLLTKFSSQRPIGLQDRRVVYKIVKTFGGWGS